MFVIRMVSVMAGLALTVAIALTYQAGPAAGPTGSIARTTGPHACPLSMTWDAAGCA